VVRRTKKESDEKMIFMILIIWGAMGIITYSAFNVDDITKPYKYIIIVFVLGPIVWLVELIEKIVKWSTS